MDGQKVGGRVWGIRGSRRELVGYKKDGDGNYLLDKKGNFIPIYKRVSNVPFSKLLEFRVSLELALKFRQSVQRQLNFEFKRLGFWCANYSPEWLEFFSLLDQSEYVENNPPDEFPDWELDIEFLPDEF